MSPITRNDLHIGNEAGRPPLSAVNFIAMLLMIVGALNWGLVGALQLDLVAAIFGPMTLASRAVYLLVGLAGLYGIYLLARWHRAV
jgi:uncharacterized membrane protein YuzA (DUF378 family)